MKKHSLNNKLWFFCSLGIDSLQPFKIIKICYIGILSSNLSLCNSLSMNCCFQNPLLRLFQTIQKLALSRIPCVLLRKELLMQHF